MTGRELLSHAIVVNQSICFDCDVSIDDIKKFAIWLPIVIRKRNLKHWRPIAFTLQHQQSTFTKEVLSNNPIFGDSPKTLIETLSKKIVIGDFDMLDFTKWGYLKPDSNLDENTFSKIFGFKIPVPSDVEGEAPKTVVTRKILNCDAEDIRVAFVTFSLQDCYKVYSNDYKTFSANSQETICSAGIKQISNLYGNIPVYDYDLDKAFSSRTQSMKEHTPFFIILFKRGTGFVSADENSNSIIKECRDKFCFGETYYDISDLFSISYVDERNKRIVIEYNVESPNEQQLQAILRNA